MVGRLWPGVGKPYPCSSALPYPTCVVFQVTCFVVNAVVMVAVFQEFHFSENVLPFLRERKRCKDCEVRLLLPW